MISRVRKAGLIVLSLVAAALNAHARVPESAQATDAEREILLELFNATGGQTWKHSGGWGSAAPVCDWYGVLCRGSSRQGPVTGLELVENNLQGVVPASLAALQGLRVLNLYGNRLTGEFPPELLERADANRLELYLSGNAVSQQLVHVSIHVDSVYGVCSTDLELELAAEINGPDNRAVYEIVRCAGPRERNRTTYCLRGEGPAPLMDGVSRALRRLAFQSASPHYSAPGGLASHQGSIRTEVRWGSGVSQTVESVARQGPIDVWIGQRLLLGLVSNSWERTARRVSCDTLKLVKQ